MTEQIGGRTRRQFLAGMGGFAGATLTGGSLVEFLAACGNSSNATTGGKIASLTIIQSAEPTSLQPDIDTNNGNLRVESEIFEGATKYVYGSTLKVVPALAESWSQISDSVWRFKVRPGLKFSNGEVLDANAFKFGLDTYYADKAKGLALIPKITIAVVDQLTFDVTTPTPNFAPLPSLMTFIYAYPPKYYAEKGKDGFAAAPVGSGPYMQESWQHGVAITLKENPNYWGPKPAIPQLVFKYVVDESSRISQLETGEADIVGELSPQLTDRVKALQNARLVTVPGARRLFLGINCAASPTDSVLVRRALNYAVDQDSIVKTLFKGHAHALKGIFLPGEIGYDPKFTGYKHDPAMAKQLLTQAGHPNGLTLDFHYSVGASPLDKEVSEAIQGQLQAAGITLNMLPSTNAQILQYYSSKKATGLTLYSFGPIYDDPSFLCGTIYFSSKSTYPYYNDPVQDKLAVDAAAETNEAKRNVAYQQFQKFVMDAAEWVPLYGLENIYGLSNRMAWQPPLGTDLALNLESAKPA